MTQRVALLATTTADVTAGLLASRLAYLLAAGWDARLFCKGRRWGEAQVLRDPRLTGRVELAERARSGATPFDRRLVRLAPDLIHFHSGAAAWKSIRRGRFPSSRLVISFRDDGQDLALPEPQLISQRAALLVFGHRAGLERAVARGFSRERAAVLHTSVAPARVGAAGRDGTPTPGVLRVLSAGSLIWEQGLEHSVHAIRLLRDAGVACHYRIVGEGDHLQAVAFARHQLDLVSEVEILAPEGGERLADELTRADVFLDPAVTDTTSPAPMIAARACGLPFVATRREGLSEVGGIAVPRRDPGAIAQALARLAGDPGLRVSLGEHGRRSAPADDHLAELERLYRRALDGAS